MNEERKENLLELSETVRKIRQTLKHLALHGDNSPDETSQKLKLGALIEDLLATVTPQEQRDFDIW